MREGERHRQLLDVDSDDQEAGRDRRADEAPKDEEDGRRSEAGRRRTTGIVCGSRSRRERASEFPRNVPDRGDDVPEERPRTAARSPSSPERPTRPPGRRRRRSARAGRPARRRGTRRERRGARCRRGARPRRGSGRRGGAARSWRRRPTSRPRAAGKASFSTDQRPDRLEDVAGAGVARAALGAVVALVAEPDAPGSAATRSLEAPLGEEHLAAREGRAVGGEVADGRAGGALVAAGDRRCRRGARALAGSRPRGGSRARLDMRASLRIPSAGWDRAPRSSAANASRTSRDAVELVVRELHDLDPLRLEGEAGRASPGRS